MKLKVITILAGVAAMQELGNERFPMAVAMIVTKFKQELDAIVTTHTEQAKLVLENYGTEDEKTGGYIIKDPADVKAYQAELKALGEAEVEVSEPPFNIALITERNESLKARGIQEMEVSPALMEFLLVIDEA